MSFAWNLKTLRSQAGMTQGELGDKIGVSQKTISSWETGRTFPTMGDVTRLCSILNCTMEKLTGTKGHDINDVSLEDILLKIRSLSLEELYQLKQEVTVAVQMQERIQRIEEERKKHLAQIADYEAEINALKEKINNLNIDDTSK